jgi:hypothetical protein
VKEERFFKARSNHWIRKVGRLNKFLLDFKPKIDLTVVVDQAGNVAFVDVELSKIRRLSLLNQSVENSFLQFRSALLNLELEHFVSLEAKRIATSETKTKEQSFVTAVLNEQVFCGKMVIE